MRILFGVVPRTKDPRRRGRGGYVLVVKGDSSENKRALDLTVYTEHITRVHRESVVPIGPPVQILILSIGIRAPSRRSTLGLISCSHPQQVGVWRIPSRLVIRVNILLVHERNLQQVATQTGHGAYCVSSPLRFAPSALILVLGHGHVRTGVECSKQEYPHKK